MELRRNKSITSRANNMYRETEENPGRFRQLKQICFDSTQSRCACTKQSANAGRNLMVRLLTLHQEENEGLEDLKQK